MRRILATEAKRRITAAVRAFEAKTSAELVVVLRRESGGYRGIAAALGAAAAALVLLAVLFLPQPFSVEAIPFDVALGFVVGAAAGSVPPVKRLLLPRRITGPEITSASKVAFYDRGVTRTTGRTGVLVYASVLETDVRVLCDVGVARACREHVEAAEKTLRRALATDDVESFAKELEGWGSAFEGPMPRAADDVNELPDEVG